MRVSHRGLYNNLLTYLNESVSTLYELNLKASSQKRINRPSDDPLGTYRVLSLRDSLSAIGRYKQNVSTAKGWLGLADETLLEASNGMIRLKALAEQAATGTMTADNREQIASEARQIFRHMISLSNASFEGKSIFAGHKIDANAFEEGLRATSNTPGLDTETMEVTGRAERTILVQFTSSGPIGSAEFRYSKDGGRNWVEGNTVTDGVLDMDGAAVRLGDLSAEVTATDGYNDTSGTWLWIRPTAYYRGDDQDAVTVDRYGSAIQAEASGSFGGNVMVRIDGPAGTAVGSGIEVVYSFSLDGGRSWVTGKSNDNSSPALSLAVPGGFLNLSGGDVASGEQFVIRPNTARLEVEISSSQTIQLNSIGKEIFGGVYENRAVFDGEARNLFETIGKLVGYLETNNQHGVQQSLEDLTKSQQHLLNRLAEIGARENRIESQERLLSGLQLKEKAQISSVEDVDLAELLANLSKEEIIYQAVLKSSSSIMRMSLMNYI
jgi:flagellar hook-associated protein 3 FlgL